jgi:hypothetical protein
MNISTVRALFTGSIVTGAAVVGLATPAQAMQAPTPQDGGASTGASQPASSDSGWQIDAAAEGLLVGVLLAGGGMAAVVTLRRHTRHVSHLA